MYGGYTLSLLPTDGHTTMNQARQDHFSPDPKASRVVGTHETVDYPVTNGLRTFRWRPGNRACSFSVLFWPLIKHAPHVINPYLSFRC